MGIESKTTNLANIFAFSRNIAPPDAYSGGLGIEERWSVKDMVMDWVTLRNFVRLKDAEATAEYIIKQIEKMETA